MTLDKTPQGKPVWNGSIYMWRIEGGIQQVHETNEPDTIAACLKLQHKSKSERCTQAWCVLLKYSSIH
jgi:hypothetical protein